MLRLVEIGAGGEGPYAEIMEIRRSDDLVDTGGLRGSGMMTERALEPIQPQSLELGFAEI